MILRRAFHSHNEMRLIFGYRYPKSAAHYLLNHRFKLLDWNMETHENDDFDVFDNPTKRPRFDSSTLNRPNSTTLKRPNPTTQTLPTQRKQAKQDNTSPNFDPSPSHSAWI